jgi:hypothetical protein
MLESGAAAAIHQRDKSARNEPRVTTLDEPRVPSRSGHSSEDIHPPAPDPISEDVGLRSKRLSATIADINSNASVRRSAGAMRSFGDV